MAHYIVKFSRVPSPAELALLAISSIQYVSSKTGPKGGIADLIAATIYSIAYHIDIPADLVAGTGDPFASTVNLIAGATNPIADDFLPHSQWN